MVYEHNSQSHTSTALRIIADAPLYMMNKLGRDLRIYTVNSKMIETNEGSHSHAQIP